MSIFKPVTVVTGASVGIGAALARVFAGNGHEVALVARREKEMVLLANELAVSCKYKPHVITADLQRSDAPARIAHELLGRGLEPAIVVNNAGFGLHGEAADLDRGEQLAMLDLNVRALTDLSLRWIDGIVKHQGGILNVASVAGFLPGPGMAVYYASKAYVLNFTKLWERDWGGYLQVNWGYHPGHVVGLRVDNVGGDLGDPEDPALDSRLRVSPVLTWFPTEFSKLRLQYNFDQGDALPRDEHSLWLQMEFLLGAHAAHKF